VPSEAFSDNTADIIRASCHNVLVLQKMLEEKSTRGIDASLAIMMADSLAGGAHAGVGCALAAGDDKGDRAYVQDSSIMKFSQ
jgi:hypothetical protein